MTGKVRFGGRSIKNSGRVDGDAVSALSLQIKLVLCLTFFLEIVPLSHSVAVQLGKLPGSEK